MTLPLLVVGHGTRDQTGVEQFRDFTARLAQLAPHLDVAGGFIELAEPPITDAVAQLTTLGHRDVVAVPLVLVAASHSKGDVPAALLREQMRTPGLSFRYGRPLGVHPTVVSLLDARARSVVAETEVETTAIVLAGRGATDPDANADVAKVARLLWEGRGWPIVEPAFISLTTPSVPDAMERCRRLGATRIVVVPYFLFSGVLPDRVALQAREYAGAHQQLDVRIADLIGGDDLIAELVLERYREAIGGDIRMNCDTCAYRVALPGFDRKLGAPQSPHDHPADPAGDHHHHDHDHSVRA